VRSLGAVLVVLAVLAYLAAVALLYPQALAFDALSFVMSARAGVIDYGHALYLPLLRVAGTVAGHGAAPERVAQLVSALGGALGFALLWRRIERGGAARPLAALVAACFALSTLLWQEAGSVEPTTWTVAALLVAGEAADACARRATSGRFSVLLAAFAVAVGFHLVSVCALPWLAWRARGAQRGLAPARLLALAGAALAVLFLAFLGGELATYLRYWSGFVPDFRGGIARELGEHLRRGGRLLLEGAPVLLALAIVSATLAWRARLREAREAAWLGAPYLAAFLLFGRPLVALLVPVLLAGALLVGRIAAASRAASAARAAGPPPGAAGVVLGLSAALQLALTLPQALEWRQTPDASRARAELLALHVPAGARLFAGPLTNHLRYYWPALDVVSLPGLWHDAHARDRSVDPVALVRREVESAGKPCLLSSDGAAFLLGEPAADLTRLGISLERAIPIPGDPKLALFPLGE